MKYSDEQLQIINSRDKNVMVHAVAGAGKTTTIKGIIKKALSKGIKADHIMACTFTRKMAKELRDGNRRLEWVDTIHGICFRIVDQYKELVGYNRITLVDDIEDKEIIKTILTRNNFKLTQTRAHELISNYCGTGIISAPKKLEETFLKAYLRELRSNDLITYSLIELYASQILTAHPEIGFDIVIVDEYQDTTSLEADILRRLAKERLIVVGDVMQSIYGFRDANLQNMAPISGRKEYSMRHSYRLCEPIASFANSLIRKNDFDYALTIESNGKDGTVDLVNELSSESVCDSVANLLGEFEPGEIFVLTRTNHQIQHLLEVMTDLPVDKELSAIRNMKYLSYLDIACGAFYNPQYDRGMVRLLRLFDYRDAQLIAMEYDQRRICDIVKNDVPMKEFDAIMRRKISFREKAEALLPMFEKQRGEYDRFMYRVLPYLDSVYSDTEYMEWYQDMSVADFMPKDKIAVITAHTAKGMENEAVVIPYVIDGTFPNNRSEIQEELRLFYVACTRARKHLVIHYDNSMYIGDI